jgi:uncharacterized protein
VRIGKAWEIGWDVAARDTERAMADAEPVIYQATFVDGAWRGLADFVVRQRDGTYEALDTKLARHARPAHVIQLCFYTEQIARIQGSMPRAMQVVTGAGETEAFDPNDYLAFYRRLRLRFFEAVTSSAPTYPYPVEHCGLCDFLSLCKAQWERDDHLTIVAGISRTQVERLTAAGITTLEALGDFAPGARVKNIRPETLDGLRLQAELQLHHRRWAEHRIQHLPLEADRGFNLMPEPSPGDIWLDLVRGCAWARVPLRLGLPRRRRAALRLHLGRGSRDREGRIRAARRPDRRAPAPLSGHARLPLRELRTQRAHPPDGRVRDPRGRDR